MPARLLLGHKVHVTYLTRAEATETKKSVTSYMYTINNKHRVLLEFNTPFYILQGFEHVIQYHVAFVVMPSLSAVSSHPDSTALSD